MSDTTLFSQPGCGPCAGAKKKLHELNAEHGLCFQVIDVTQDEAAYNEIKAAGATGTPVLKHEGTYYTSTTAVLGALRQLTKELNA